MSFSEPNSHHLRKVLIFCFNMKKSVTVAHRMLKNGFITITPSAENHGELLNYEKLSDKPEIDDKTFERDGFGEQPLYLCNVATCDEKIIGYAVSHYTYSTWCGKGMLLQDLYVTSDFRGKHVGSKLLKAVAKEAIENDCHKLDFVVLEWNPAQEFYKRHGAIDLSSKEPWHRYRILEKNLKKLASDCE
ncbi:Diamine acetyltransferase 2 [Trachymyrmex cornetzi]|uniref:Diamine acetyltransferase 2 n=1 Tax=Trachymyrmex cornetzi TaxID=471704 RepID=A0A195DF80_9HYME|nr:Diamine acetyltransferase 2 [Trachymyrmex cornetzi]